MERGFTRVRPLQGGFDAWVEAGFPLDSEPLVAVREAAGLPTL